MQKQREFLIIINLMFYKRSGWGRYSLVIAISMVCVLQLETPCPPALDTIIMHVSLVRVSPVYRKSFYLHIFLHLDVPNVHFQRRCT
jgi:hypothetical protein